MSEDTILTMIMVTIFVGILALAPVGINVLQNLLHGSRVYSRIWGSADYVCPVSGGM